MAKFKCYAFLCKGVNEWQRNVLGSSAGYANGCVAIPPEHPLYGSQAKVVDIDVHGGITFAQKSNLCNMLRLADVTESLDGELMDGYWVLGFNTLRWDDNLENCPREYCLSELVKLKSILENWEE